jgi:hypothetical protein
VIYLHIGRNKAGSTTLQDFFLKNIAELERHGIHYALYGHLKDSVPGVPGFDRQDAIASYARTYPERSLLISHEWMLQWDAIHAEIMAAALRGLPVKIIVHMRPYPSWICSNYAQDVRIGESSEHFDDYFESFRPKLSMWPDLRRWGELFGWDNVIVRLIDARNTPWRSLTGDFLEILGLDAGLGSAVPPSNQSAKLGDYRIPARDVTAKSRTGHDRGAAEAIAEIPGCKPADRARCSVSHAGAGAAGRGNLCGRYRQNQRFCECSARPGTASRPARPPVSAGIQAIAAGYSAGFRGPRRRQGFHVGSSRSDRRVARARAAAAAFR